MTSTHWPTQIAAVCFLLASLALGRLTGDGRRSSNSFLNGTRSLPGWVAALSFLACNCGALEIVGLSGITARYGIQALHFYLIGAVPAMIFMGFVVIPVYAANNASSVPEYLGKRFGPGTRTLQACILLVSSALFAGLCLYSVAEVMQIASGWDFRVAATALAIVVLAYVMRGGFRATVHNEIFQFFVMVTGLAPLLYFTRDRRPDAAAMIGQRWHLWQTTPVVSGSAPVDLIGVILGLGFVISFSYWCTDFVLVQRALSARTVEAARRVPILAGFGKLLFSMIVVLPVLYFGGHPQSVPGSLDHTMPSLLVALYGPKLFWLGIAALVAGLVNGFASNVSAFSALWTREVYRVSLQPHRSETHYIAMGRIAQVVCVALSLGTASLTLKFEGLSDFTLFIFSFSLVPFFGLVVVGVLSRRGNATSAICGVLAGMCTGIFGRLGPSSSWMPSGSPLSRDFHTAIASFCATVGVCLMGSRPAPASSDDLSLSESAWGRLKDFRASPTMWILTTILVTACIVLNLLWW